MSTSPLSPEEIRAAAAAQKELGPEYSDAVIESFLERVDREITARVDARLGPVSREQPAQPAQSNGRRTLLTGQGTASVMTSPPAGGPNATATSSISTRQSLALACLSPEPATSGCHFAARSHGAFRFWLAPVNGQLQAITPTSPGRPVTAIRPWASRAR